MIRYRLRHFRRAAAPMPAASEQLTRLVYELLDAHDDTARIATGRYLDARWQAAVLGRFGRLRIPITRSSRKAPISRNGCA
jgi:hypothetical protein